jgi:2-methylisocitrate lyase-like PEP mutase family enzyme
MTVDRVNAFRELHATGCFVIPNPWDVGSARLLVQLGFKALATTSSGFAWSCGRPDHEVSLDDALEYFRTIAVSVDVPVSADFEGAFATEPSDVAVNAARAIATGIAGFSIEDSTGNSASPLFDFHLSV